MNISFEEFKAQMRANRGKLTRHDEDLATIYVGGTDALIDFALNKKLMGVKNIAWIADQSKAYQDKFTVWMADKGWKADKNEVELWATVN